jgi:hypothetical protein
VESLAVLKDLFIMSLSFRRLRLFQRRAVCCPTLFGSFLILTLLVIPVAWWFARGESFLSLTERLPAKVLVVEGWIGYEGVRAAAAEFEQRGYQYGADRNGSQCGHCWLERLDRECYYGTDSRHNIYQDNETLAVGTVPAKRKQALPILPSG